MPVQQSISLPHNINNNNNNTNTMDPTKRIIPKPIIRRDSGSSTPAGRPSLLAGLTLPGGFDEQNDSGEGGSGSTVPPRPRRLWKVNDTSLKPVPYFYPPLDPRCSVFVSDAPPSVVAVRIAECLRKRSISVEYDEEAVRHTDLDFKL